MFDDFQALIDYTVQLHRLHGWWPKLLFAFAAQHDEYKLIFEHLVVLLQLSFSPHLEYRLLVIIGNLFTLGILAVYWRSYFIELPLAERLLRFAPISFLLMQLNYVETLDWAMCGLQMLPVIFFSLLSFHLLMSLPRSRGRFAGACAAVILACLASANGFIAAPIGVIFLVEQRAWRRALTWSASFVPALAAYLYHYQPITRAALLQPTLLQKFTFMLSFLGGAVENMHHFPVRNASVLIGLIAVCAWIYALFSGYRRTNPFAYNTALWILICAAGVTQVRSKLGLELSLTGRYKVYSDMLLIFTYAFAVERFMQRARLNALTTLPRKRLAYAGALTFAVLLNFSSAWFGYKFLKHRADTYAQAFRVFIADPQHNSPEVSLTDQPILSGEPEFSRRVLLEAIQSGVFVPPDNP